MSRMMPVTKKPNNLRDDETLPSANRREFFQAEVLTWLVDTILDNSPEVPNECPPLKSMGWSRCISLRLFSGVVDNRGALRCHWFGGHQAIAGEVVNPWWIRCIK